MVIASWRRTSSSSTRRMRAVVCGPVPLAAALSAVECSGVMDHRGWGVTRRPAAVPKGRSVTCSEDAIQSRLGRAPVKCRPAAALHRHDKMTNDDDIDRLILELHATDAPSHATGDVARIERWLRLLASRGGSDLLLVAGAPPSIRVDGRVQPLAEGPLDGVDIEDAVLPALPPHARRIYRDAHIVDASFRLSGVGR